MTAGKVSRRMLYPYTLTSKIALFPYAYYIKNNWLYRYHLIGFALTMPLFMWISSKANSPGNVAAFAERKAKEEHGH